MCVRGMHFEIQYILQALLPTKFQDLATRAHDIEMSIMDAGGKHVFHMEQRQEKKEIKKTEKISKGKEAMSVNTAPLRIKSRAKATASTLPNQPTRQERPKVSL